MNNFKKEISRFLIVGIFIVAADAAVYYSSLFFLEPWLAKAFAFICGTIVAYVANKFWTFKKPGYSKKELIKFIILYMVAIVVNVAMNSLVLSLSNSFVFSYVVATGASASLNFIGQKRFVFNS
ncbi:MAG: GtrA family protein [Patescibacteria group bacterium]|mgnify:CR=1 FL=1